MYNLSLGFSYKVHYSFTWNFEHSKSQHDPPQTAKTLNADLEAALDDSSNLKSEIEDRYKMDVRNNTNTACTINVMFVKYFHFYPSNFYFQITHIGHIDSNIII